MSPGSRQPPPALKATMAARIPRSPLTMISLFIRWRQAASALCLAVAALPLVPAIAAEIGRAHV